MRPSLFVIQPIQNARQVPETSYLMVMIRLKARDSNSDEFAYSREVRHQEALKSR